MKAGLQSWASQSKWVRWLIITLLILGIFFRFANLDQKPYDTDEVRGILRASGYTSQEFIERVFTGDIILVTEVQKYQKPNDERTLSDAVNALTGNPEHPPLYYLLARFWMQWFDASVGSRYLSAVLGVLVLPCAYWLCLELFESSQVGWATVALLSVSPFQVLYAQQARQYSLWLAVTLLSSAVLLRSLRVSSVRNWSFYALTVALGLYSHLFFVWTAIGHALYVAVMEGLPWGKKSIRSLLAYTLASLVGLLTFSPWIWVFITNADRTKGTTKWVSSFKTGILTRLDYWIHNLNLVFLDFNQDRNPLPLPYNLLLGVAYLLIVLLVGYAIYYLCRHTPRRVWVFLLLLIGVTAIAQVIPDLLKGGRRSLLPRYLLPSYVGIQLVVAYLLATKPWIPALKPWQQRFWRGTAAVVISIGVVSCAVSVQAPTWWTKGSSSINPQVAPFINQAERPLVVSDASHTFVLSLSHYLKPATQLQLFRMDTFEQQSTKLSQTRNPSNTDTLFLYFPTDELLTKFIQVPSNKLDVVVGNSKWFPDRNWLYKVSRQ